MAYHIPAIRIIGRVCKTNTPSNGAMRGAGGPQGGFIIENIIESIGVHLGIGAFKVSIIP